MYYRVRNWCEDEVVYKYTDQVVLDPAWQAPECVSGVHTTRDFTVLEGDNPNHSCRAYRVTNQSIPNNAETVVQFDAVDWDVFGEMDIVTNKGRFTAKYPGCYSVRSIVSFASSSDQSRYCNIDKNGALEIPGGKFESPDAPEVGAAVCTAAGDVYLDGVADYIEIPTFQKSGGALNAFGGRTKTMVMIRFLHG